MPKKKLLPKDFDELLAQGDLATLQSVFATCDVDARGGPGKQTALAFDLCPDDLARWLVANGADLAAADTWGNTVLHSRADSRRSSIAVLLQLGADPRIRNDRAGTPLHAAARSSNARNAELLIAAGAEVDALDADGLTPLELAVRGASNADLERVATFADALLSAGAVRTPRLTGFVEEIGKRFEFFRERFNPETVDAASAALDRLYALFDARPVPRRAMHDGKSLIAVKPGAWQDQHRALWDLLVPASGAAATMQGELIRLSGRIGHELDGNGGVNWDADFNRMVDAALAILACGEPLAQSDLSEAAAFAAQVKRRPGETSRLAQFAVAWVQRNPAPIALPAPTYRR